MVLIETESLKQLAVGSYEHVIRAVEKAVQERAAALFGEQSPVEIIATFPGNAVVLAESGKMIRVHFERSSVPGEVSITKHEILKPPVFHKALDYAKNEALAAVRAWGAGRLAEARERLAKAAPYVTAPPLNERKIVEQVVSDLRAPRAWKQLWAGGREAISEVVGRVTVEALKAKAPVPKYTSLYEGTVQNVQTYEGLVRSDLARLRECLEAVSKLTTASYARAKALISKLPPEKAVGSLTVFAEDLLLDLQRLRTILVESERLSDVGLLGKLHDAVASAITPYLIGGQFVSAVSQRLEG